ncbi:MAG: hypothetical protein OHK0048_14140 [Rhodoferax sp.]
MQCVLDALPNACLIKDFEQRLLVVNAAAAGLLGGTPQDLPGKALVDQVPPQVRASILEQDQQVWTQGSAQGLDESVWDASGQCWRLMHLHKVPLFDARGKPLAMVVSLSEHAGQRDTGCLPAFDLDLLELLTRNVPLPELLRAFVNRLEASDPDVMSSVLLLDADGQRLRYAVAPRLPLAYCQAVDGVTIGPRVGSCGTAAYTRQVVIVSDIAKDPLWADYRDLALAHGLRACWSVPLLSPQAEVLGTLANYHKQPKRPSAEQINALKRSAYLLALVIAHHRGQELLEQQRWALAESEARYRSLVEWSPMAVVVHRDGVLIYVNEAAQRLLHAQRASDLLGRPIADILHPQDRAVGLMRAQRAMQLGEAAPAIEERLVCLDGAVVHVEVQSKPIVYDGAPAVYVVATDVTQRRRDEQMIHNLAFYDSLTGLPNRRFMLDRLQHVLAGVQRSGCFGAVLLLDLDHFKTLNDVRGHELGDALLKLAAERLRACLRVGDSVGRVGGDEFLMLLECESDDAERAALDAQGMAQSVLHALRQECELGQERFAGSASIGAVVFAAGRDEVTDVMRFADAALYQAKAAGRDTVCFYDPAMQARMQARVALERDMREGLAQQQFALHYQLQVDREGLATGAEALLRWKHPKRGWVPPGEFIPLAEENGFILALGQWILETACAQLVAWARAPTTEGWVLAVNVSARQFAQLDFVDHVRQALERTGANPQRLKLELTESMLVHDVQDVIAKMNQVKALGVGFSLDDFGTGYSSLSYLKTLPLGQLKIDKSFVRDLLTDPNDAVICRTVVALGHSLGMRVIAEGVETQAQRDALVDMDCDAFQGYFFSRPVPPAQLAQALASLPVTS